MWHCNLICRWTHVPSHSLLFGRRPLFELTKQRLNAVAAHCVLYKPALIVVLHPRKERVERFPAAAGLLTRLTLRLWSLPAM
jgi:hypothetical protein